MRDDSSAYPSQRNPASDDFFTDSLLDTSKILTPSPSKKHLKNGVGSKPRRAIGNTRTLRAAWDATASSGRPSSSGSDMHSLQGSFKRAPLQARGRSPADPARPHSTPTLTRGRQTSLPLASPYSSDASSPPGGLNDVYQRIADEERLAAQEGDIEEDEFTDSTMPHDDYVDEDRARLDRIRTSQSPLKFRSHSRNTPQPQAADANKENLRDDADQTEASGMSFLENMTDQVLAAKLTPHTQDRARDRARLEKAVQKTTPLAFTKAQVGSKNALTSDNLQRSGKREKPESVHSSSDGSLRNEDTAPPPNVPRTWGTKGRVDKDWLRKIHKRNGSPASGTSNGDKHEPSPVDWTAAAAEVPLPSVEDSLTPRPEHSRNATPTSLSKQTSLDRIRQWELNDFTGNNLHVSESPPVKVRTNVPDHFKDREIATLEKRAVTTNRLGEIRKKNSRELLVGKARSSSVEPQKGVEDRGHAAAEEAITQAEEKGEPIPDTPIVVYKAFMNGTKKDENGKSRPLHDRKDSRDSLQRLARAISESPRPSSTPEDWSFIKEEEVESARRETTKPGKMQNQSRQSSKEVANANPTPLVKRSKSADAARTPIVTGAWTDTILPDTIKTVKQRHAPTKYAQTPHVTGGWIDTPLAVGKRQSSALAPIPMEQLSEEPTTTDPIKDKTAKPSSTGKNIDTKNLASKRAAPTLPRSALTSLLTKAKRKLAATSDRQPNSIPEEEQEEEQELDHSNDTLNLGDATIESLEDLLTLDPADMTTLLRMGAEYEVGEHTTPNDPSGRRNAKNPNANGSGGGGGTETELLARLGTKLERLRTNIHDARKGISKLEFQVSHPESQQSTSASKATALVKPANGHIGKSVAPCQACGCPRSPTITTTTNTNNVLFSSFPLPFLSYSTSDPNARLYLTLPIPRLWHPPQPPQSKSSLHQLSRYIPRPTPLGYLVLILWLWYLMETLLCARYCVPEYAEAWTWPDPFDGRGRGRGFEGMKWGSIGWRLVGRWAGDGWMGMGWSVLTVVVRLVGGVMGWGLGFLRELIGGGVGAGDGERRLPMGFGVSQNHAGIGYEAAVLGMGEDEFL